MGKDEGAPKRRLESLDAYSERVMKNVNPSIPLSKLMQKPICAVCGEDLGNDAVWKPAPDGETYQTCPGCKFKE